MYKIFMPLLFMISKSFLCVDWLIYKPWVVDALHICPIRLPWRSHLGALYQRGSARLMLMIVWWSDLGIGWEYLPQLGPCISSKLKKIRIRKLFINSFSACFFVAFLTWNAQLLVSKSFSINKCILLIVLHLFIQKSKIFLDLSDIMPPPPSSINLVKNL